MATIQLMKHCATCGHRTLHVQQVESNVFHLLMTLVTFGVWLVVWLTAPIRKSGAQCTVCGHSWLSGQWARLSNTEKAATCIGAISLVIIVASLSANTSGFVASSAPLGQNTLSKNSSDPTSPESSDVNVNARIESMEDLRAEGRWIIEEGKSPIDDSPSVLIGRRSIQPYGSAYGEDSYGYLAIRCKENKTDVVVGSDEFLDLLGPVRVTVRFDGATASTQSWHLSSTSKAAFSPEPIKLIKQMLVSEKLIVRLNPTAAADVTTSFDMRGLNSVIEKLQKACHWK